MALRDQPYIPLYIQDFLTDEKLIECSAESTGVYIRIMCIMHKSDEYGKILLKQKDKQTDKQNKNFALKLAKQLPYSVDVVTRAIDELLHEKVLVIEGDFLIQKRMVNDNLLSLKRSKAGFKGGKFAQAKIKANNQANTEYENEIENENVIELRKGVQGKNNFHDTWQSAFDQIWIEQACMMKFKTLNIPRELEHFRNKCDSAPDDYYRRDKNGLRLAFLHQLKNAKPEKENGTIKIINDKLKLDALIEAKYGKANTTS